MANLPIIPLPFRTRLHSSTVACALMLVACEHGAPVAPQPSQSTQPEVNPAKLVIWRNHNISGYVNPVVDASAIYTVDYNRTLTAIAKADGQTRWTTSLPAPSAAPDGYGLSFAAGLLIVGDGTLVGVDPASGKISWSYTPSVGRYPGYGSQASDGATVYCGSTTGHAYAVDGATGRELWATVVVPDTNVRVLNPVTVNGVVYVRYVNGVTRTGGTAAIDAQAGRLRWVAPFPQPGSPVTGATESYGGVVVAGSMVMSASADGTLYGLDTATGAVRYAIPPTMLTQYPAYDGSIFDRVLAIAGNAVIVTSPGGTITALDPTDLHRLWITTPADTIKIPHASPVPAPIGGPIGLVVDGQFIYVGYLGACVKLRVADGGFEWLLRSSALDTPPLGDIGIMTSPAIDSDRFYLVGDYAAYAFSKQ